MMYYMLISSLPRHSREYKIKKMPISHIQLEKRLNLLTESEKNVLINIINCLWSSWFDPTLSFQATMTKSNELLALKIPFVEELIYWFFDIRSIFVALRLRNIQTSPPSNPQAFWVSRLNAQLIKNWDTPDFGMKSIYPWLGTVSLKMASKNTIPFKSENRSAFLEDTLLTLIWKHLDNIEGRHFYDFEALIIYLMRWNVVNYWSQFNEKIACDHIQELTDKILAESIDAGMLNQIEAFAE